MIFDWIEGAKLAVRRGMTGATGNIYCGLHEYADMRFVLDNLKPGDLFTDIGANVGSYTVLASKVCGARTISIEPDPDTVRALKRNIEINAIEESVRIVEAALGAAEGETRFTVGYDTINRVAKPEDVDTRVVPVKTLDGVLADESPALIKMDVEGYEAEVLRGAGRTLSNPALKAIIIETLDHEVFELLSAAGFRRVYYDAERRMITQHIETTSANSLMIRGAI